MKIMNVILISLLAILSSCSGCKKPDVPSVGNFPQTNQFISSIAGVTLSGDTLLINGSSLENVLFVKIKSGSNTYDLNIDSKSGASLSAKLAAGISLALGSTFDIIIGNAYGQAVTPAIFNVANDSITTEKINNRAITTQKIAGPLGGVGVSNGQILSWNGSAWTPTTPGTSQIYSGSYDAATNTPDLVNLPGPVIGNYYIVSVSGVQDLGYGNVTLNTGDWLIYNGINFDKIASSNTVNSVFGRQNSVVAQANDYTWAQINKTTSSIGDIADVDLLTPPLSGEALIYDGSKWSPGAISIPANSVTDTQINNDSISISKINGLSTQLTSITTTLSGKEPTITTDLNSKVFRGDKTFVTLDTSIVPENGNLYFTNARAVSALSSTLSGYTTTTANDLKADKTYVDAQIASVSGGGSTLTSTDELTEGSSNLYFTNARAVSALSSTLTGYATTSSVNGKVNSTGGTITGDLSLDTLLKLKDSSTNYISLRAPASVTTYSLTLPSTKGTNGQVLTTDGDGTTNWTTVSGGGGAVNTVNTQSGDVVLTSSDITEGANLYFTNARAVTALSSALSGKADLTNVAQTITAAAVTGLTTPTAGSDAVNKTYVDAAITGVSSSISGKEDTITSGASTTYIRGDKTLSTFLTDVLGSVLTGVNLTVNAVISASDTVLTAFGKLQKQISDLSTTVSGFSSTISGKADTTNVAQTITAAAVTGLTTPVADSDAANKKYVVDSLVNKADLTNASQVVTAVKVTGLSAPTTDTDAANKLYVDNSVPKIVYVSDVKPAGTHGGSLDPANGWENIRDLNTVTGDTSFLTLASNQITLAAGTYEINISVPAFLTNHSKSALVNVTTSEFVLPGTNVRSHSVNGGQERSLINGIITIATPTTYVIKQRGNTLSATGRGMAATFSTGPAEVMNEVYTQVKITKLR